MPIYVTKISYYTHNTVRSASIGKTIEMKHKSVNEMCVPENVNV